MDAPARLLLACVLLCAARAGAEPAASGVFDRYAGRIVQIASLEKGAETRSSYGTGFYVGAEGLLATNYHVVSDEVLEPETHALEITDHAGKKLTGKVVDFDIIHDLAIVKTEPAAQIFALHPVSPAHGLRLFSFGYPNDLALSVVEGTFNGVNRMAMVEQYHFTGAINPGMSGGPAVTEEGEVVGINDASEGNSVGFLEPVQYLLPLLEHAQKSPATDLLARARDQLLAYQRDATALLLRTPLVQRELGGQKVPGQWLPELKCWASEKQAKPRYYASTSYDCHDENRVFVSDTQRSGMLRYASTFLDGRGLNRFHFAALAEDEFDGNYWRIDAGEDDVTKFKCHTDFVAVNGSHLKVAFCARAYRRLAGLCDAVVQIASVDGADRAVQSTFELAGFTVENATRLAQRYVEGFTWVQ